jgi:hypothetical protein
VSKFREAMKAGEARFHAQSGKNRNLSYVELFVCFGAAAVQLVHAYRSRSIAEAVIAVAVWLVIVPTFSWFWSRPTAPIK